MNQVQRRRGFGKDVQAIVKCMIMFRGLKMRRSWKVWVWLAIFSFRQQRGQAYRRSLNNYRSNGSKLPHNPSHRLWYQQTKFVIQRFIRTKLWIIISTTAPARLLICCKSLNFVVMVKSLFYEGFPNFTGQTSGRPDCFLCHTADLRTSQTCFWCSGVHQHNPNRENKTRLVQDEVFGSFPKRARGPCPSRLITVLLQNSMQLGANSILAGISLAHWVVKDKVTTQ